MKLVPCFFTSGWQSDHTLSPLSLNFIWEEASFDRRESHWWDSILLYLFCYLLLFICCYFDFFVASTDITQYLNVVWSFSLSKKNCQYYASNPCSNKLHKRLVVLNVGTVCFCFLSHALVRTTHSHDILRQQQQQTQSPFCYFKVCFQNK